MTSLPFSPDQIAALKTQFDVIDQNGDGRISRDEISTLLRREAYAYLTEEQRQQILTTYVVADTDGDGGVSFDEFLVLVAREQDPRAAYLKSFEAYDSDHDGFLTAADFKRVSELQGGDVTMAQADAMIQMADRNADGKVSFEEYYAIMTANVAS